METQKTKSKDWYKEMSFYQIWVRSFADGNGDGIGDLYGVYDKLEYVKSLGVDGIWFSPIYPSPNADYGYDISDYKDIHPDFGTLDQFKKVLRRAHGLGLKVIMDLVVNHTSDEHPWFKESRKGKDNPTVITISGGISPITGILYLKERHGNTMKKEASTIFISLQKSSPTLIWIIPKSARK